MSARIRMSPARRRELERLAKIELGKHRAQIINRRNAQEKILQRWKSSTVASVPDHPGRVLYEGNPGSSMEEFWNNPEVQALARMDEGAQLANRYLNNESDLYDVIEARKVREERRARREARDPDRVNRTKRAMVSLSDAENHVRSEQLKKSRIPERDGGKDMMEAIIASSKEQEAQRRAAGENARRGIGRLAEVERDIERTNQRVEARKIDVEIALNEADYLNRYVEQMREKDPALWAAISGAKDPDAPARPAGHTVSQADRDVAKQYIKMQKVRAALKKELADAPEYGYGAASPLVQRKGLAPLGERLVNVLGEERLSHLENVEKSLNVASKGSTLPTSKMPELGKKNLNSNKAFIGLSTGGKIAASIGVGLAAVGVINYLNNRAKGRPNDELFRQ